MFDKLTAVIVCCNEGEFLEDCIVSCLFADQVLVFDMQSDDETAVICEKYGVRRIEITKQPYVELVRNISIQAADNEWVIVLDPDERISKGLRDSIPALLLNKSVDAYSIPRVNKIFGTWARTMCWWPDSQLRLFRKKAVVYRGVIHETPIIDGVIVTLAAEYNNAIIHINYNDISQFFDKTNRYTTAIARDYSNSGISFNIISLLYRPSREFLKRFFYYGGYKQGLYGFIISSLMFIYHFMIWIKLWELKRKNSAQ